MHGLVSVVGDSNTCWLVFSFQTSVNHISTIKKHALINGSLKGKIIIHCLLSCFINWNFVFSFSVKFFVWIDMIICKLFSYNSNWIHDCVVEIVIFNESIYCKICAMKFALNCIGVTCHGPLAKDYIIPGMLFCFYFCLCSMLFFFFCYWYCFM